jgi:uncharacterized membrane protein YfcA
VTVLRALQFLLVGGTVGALGGLLGIGGGVLVIPALVMLFGFSQQRAVGTSLAMLLPPIGVFAVLRYARAGNVDWSAAFLMAAAFSLGAFASSTLAAKGLVSDRALRILFALFLLYIAGSMIFRSDRRVWAALGTLSVFVVYGVSFFALRLVGRKIEKKLSLAEEYKKRLDAGLPPPDYEI